MPFPVALRSHRLMADELYPVVNPAGSELPVVLRDEDGAVRDLEARSLAIRTQRDGHVRDGIVVRRGGVDVLVTDARVVFTGGRPAADCILAGHVRLDWIVAVGASAGHGFLRGDALRLVIQLDDGDYTVLTLTFDTDVDVHELAQDIARRTAHHWLATAASSPLVERWRTMAAAARLADEAGDFALHWMPEHLRVAAPLAAADQLVVPA
ncbi:hypothetical protein [Nocardioides jiangxiensis]|uniref:Urease accessory protein n=1 Tax=Nocardioides jiangxiensis TaxID=3064524 RepID=A0ABT9B0B3_9ACTN|nr:hypothetical protein [Nocardioides sp. WY-20]MDO7867840.1 hypothetical protein [Nocardioides sp. WY-20]